MEPVARQHYAEVLGLDVSPQEHADGQQHLSVLASSGRHLDDLALDEFAASGMPFQVGDGG